MTLSPSRYNTTCRKCNKAIHRGDMVSGGKGRSFCATCSGHRPEPRPTEPIGPLPTSSTYKSTALTQQNGGTLQIEFGSVVEAVSDLLVDHARNEFNRKRIADGLARWSGGAWIEHRTPAGLGELLKHPDGRILDAVERMKGEILSDVMPTETRRRRRRGVDSGDEIDVDRYLARVPEMWERTERQSTPKRTVWIGLNAWVHSKQRSPDLLWRGAAIAALAERLAVAGYSVGIVWFWCARDFSTVIDRSIERILLKSPDAPLDIAAVATACCDIGFARFVGLAGGARHVPGQVSACFGYTASCPARHRSDIDYFIDVDVTTRDGAVAWLKSCIAQAEGQPAAA